MPADFDTLLPALGQILNFGHGVVDKPGYWIFVSFILRGVLLVMNKLF